MHTLLMWIALLFYVVFIKIINTIRHEHWTVLSLYPAGTSVSYRGGRVSQLQLNYVWCNARVDASKYENNYLFWSAPKLPWDMGLNASFICFRKGWCIICVGSKQLRLGTHSGFSPYVCTGIKTISSSFLVCMRPLSKIGHFRGS